VEVDARDYTGGSYEIPISVVIKAGDYLSDELIKKKATGRFPTPFQ
jgi:hypothetical protein